MKAVRRIAPGTLREAEAGATLHCVLIAPFPEWVAIDLATGALVRPQQSAVRAVHVPAGSDLGALPEAGELTGVEVAGPLASVLVTLDGATASFDPARPEAVSVGAIHPGPALSRRSVKRLVAQLVSPAREPGLLGTVAPSFAYADLSGARPSVQVVAPVGGRAWVATKAGASSVHFRLGERDYVLPAAPAALRWARYRGAMSQGRGSPDDPRAGRAGRAGHLGRRGRNRPPGEIEGPVLLTVGLDRPRDGQVRKVVLGVFSRP
jgi:hypothetical protein